MYKSPIEIFVTEIRNQIEKQQEEEIYKAVASVGVNVDKTELLRALQYDRHQYAQGYMDGKAENEPKWISLKERKPDRDELILVFFEGMRDTNCAIQVMYGWCIGGSASHWMPLPEAPKGE